MTFLSYFIKAMIHPEPKQDHESSAKINPGITQ